MNKKKCDLFSKYTNICFSKYISNDDSAFSGSYAASGVLEALTPLAENFYIWVKCGVFKARFIAHIFVCKTCAEKRRRFLLVEHIFETGFFQQPRFSREDAVMQAVFAKDAEAVKKTPEYVSVTAWIFAGVLIVASLLSVYFNGDFEFMAASGGFHFLTAIAITIGAVITVYSAIFIATHLDMLCKKFGL
ncbi:MAG: hypothetical protein LBC53_03485 [Spirochaetaceae bacterium]|jgi:hypothetical protein|nr:hypothetical protein [Spirochaetaceae bacterium]